MMKKLIAGGAGVAAFFALAVPAFAMPFHFPSMGGTKITNDAVVKNYVTTTSNTGKNVVTGSMTRRHSGNVSLETGPATSVAEVGNVVNSTGIDCGCQTNGKLTVNNDAYVKNVVDTSSNTGFNLVSGGSTTTGEAGSRSTVSDVVNTTVVGGLLEM